MKLDEIQNLFVEKYGESGEFLSFHSPGRVNLIGEHTDYNGGFVFPCALSFGTFAVARKRNDNILNFSSTNFNSIISTSINDIVYEKDHDWANYLKGVIKEFQKLGHNLSGMDILLSGNIPNGAGLSSSASIELAMAVIIKELFQIDIDMIEMVKIGQRAENQFVGVNCGIMDQFAVGMGKQDHAIFLNCQSLDFEYVPINLKNSSLIIANTNKRRGLADSKYNERRAQCEEALRDLQTKLDINCLGDLSVDQFEEFKDLICDDICKKRAKHVVYEDHRTKEAVFKLQGDDISAFGQLMVQSHTSLKDLYEVTGIELDTLVEESLRVEGTVGSRMTGAGFGGCTVSIVESDRVEDFIKQVGENYNKKIGFAASFYVADVGDGTKRI